MVVAGKLTSLVLAVFAILAAPLVAGAPEGLYQLMQQLNGIFFIPIASIMIAGLFIPKISAMGAKVALFTGLTFYIITSFVLEVNIHFVHIWGIEFVINIAVMYAVSQFYPATKKPVLHDTTKVELKEWKYTKLLGAVLTILTILIYLFLGLYPGS
jgi:SSS family solute:Na+ symporter